jgi:hypothetical protein
LFATARPLDVLDGHSAKGLALWVSGRNASWRDTIEAARDPAATIDAWHHELLAYFDTGGISNGPTEAMNALIKKIKRGGHGFRNFSNYRLRLLMRCDIDWQTPQPARIRGHLTRLAP